MSARLLCLGVLSILHLSDAFAFKSNRNVALTASPHQVFVNKNSMKLMRPFQLRLSQENSANDPVAPAIDENAEIEGYINMDMKQLGKEKDSKQTRVFLYILFALLPCLLLVPFMMSRDFVPADGF